MLTAAPPNQWPFLRYGSSWLALLPGQRRSTEMKAQAIKAMGTTINATDGPCNDVHGHSLELDLDDAAEPEGAQRKKDDGYHEHDPTPRGA